MTGQTGGQGQPSWASVIDELRRDTAKNERLLNHDFADALVTEYDAQTVPWSPPEGLGSIPSDLRSEAALVLQRQLDVAERLASAITVSRRQQQMAGRIVGGTSAPAPAFFDSVI
ncbi:hypothetical protein [Tessaracoccus sp.]